MSKEIFEENPSLDTVYQTSDENYFYSQNAAENHAKTLKDKTVKKHANPSKKVAVEDVENVEEQIFVQTGENTDGSPKVEIKLTPKQQVQADYTEKFGEIPAEEFTTKQLTEAIEKNEKLVAEIKNN